MTAKVHYADLWGAREIYEEDEHGERVLSGGKYQWLWQHEKSTTEWTELEPQSPFYLFIPHDTSGLEDYEKGWSVRDIMPVGSMGIKTNRDHLLTDFDESVLVDRISQLEKTEITDDIVQNLFELEDSPYWNTKREREKIRKVDWKANIHRMLYRPFDFRMILYQQNLIEIGRGGASTNVMKHMLLGANIALLATRQTKDKWDVSVTDKICGHKSCSAYDITSLFPLYLYPTESKKSFFDVDEPTDAPGGRRPNLALEFIADFAARLKMSFTPDGKGDRRKTFGPEDVFDYAYAVFHSPAYRARYSEFLKIDFPRLPLTSDAELFRALCTHGARLVALHLLEARGANAPDFPVAGTNTVEAVRYTAPGEGDAAEGRVWINREQYFAGVAPEVWNFHVGGYQVCQKWLKDRKTRTLSFDDLTHYRHTVAALAETIQLMSEIDATIEARGGFPLG